MSGGVDSSKGYVGSDPTKPLHERLSEPSPDLRGVSDATPDLDKTPALAGAVVVESAPPGIVPGLMVGNYRIVRRLGSGGFASVYLARNVRLERDAALKFLTRHSDALHRQLFEREAKTCAALGKHEGIVEIYDFGEYGNWAYVALEYVPGASVEEELAARGGPLETVRALRMAGEAARALDYAHAHKVLHRDIKPQNLLVEQGTDRVKIADFGLAKFWESSETSILSGYPCGTPSYMAPEQASAKTVDRRADVYSLGATLYRLLSGQFPVTGLARSDVLDAVRKGEYTPLRERRPDLPEPVLALVEKAMAFEPDQRFQTADEFAVQIEAVVHFLEGNGPAPVASMSAAAVASPVRRGRRMLVRAALAVGLAVVVVVGLWSGLNHGGRPGSNVVYAADRLVDRHELPAAEQAYQEALRAYPGDPQAQSGLGYAYLLQQRYPEAESAFQGTGSEPLKNEGLAALAYYREEKTARQELEEAARMASQKFPEVLLGRLDLLAEQYDAVIKRLRGIERAQLRFAWQFDENVESLGQAYYHKGDWEEAQAAFERLAKTDAPNAATLAKAYLDRIQRETDAAFAEANRQRVREIQKRMEAMDYKPLSEEELWTSRPLRFIILPPDQAKGASGAKTGLGDVLPDLLGPALESGSALRGVDRNELDVTLAEQDLSAHLSSDSGQLALGQVLGARLLIKSTFHVLMKEEFLTTKVVDTETSARMSAGETALAWPVKPREVVGQVAASIQAVLAKEYPLCGRLQLGADGPALNIGGAVGVKTGMRFVVSDKPDRRTALPGVVAQVRGTPATDGAAVTLAGMAPADIPQNGLYVIEETWYKQSTGASS